MSSPARTEGVDLFAPADGQGRRWPSPRDVARMAQATRATVASFRSRDGGRGPRRIRWHDGLYLHRFADGTVIPWPDLDPPAPSRWAIDAADIFLWRHVPDPGTTVVDVGAGVGAEVPTLSRLVGPAGRVIAIEGHPESARRLARLVRHNPSLANVTVVPIAVGDRPGSIMISDFADLDANTTLPLTDDVPGVEVPVERLDDLLPRLGVEHIDLLKMNIEGAERPALAGLGDVIDCTDHVTIACHDFLGPPEAATRSWVTELLTRRGFRTWSRPDDPRSFVRDYVYGRRRMSPTPLDPGAHPSTSLRCWVRSPGALSRQTDSGLLLLPAATDRQPITVRGPGEALWPRLATPCSIEDAVAAVAEHSDVPFPVLTVDLLRVLAALEAQDLVHQI